MPFANTTTQQPKNYCLVLFHVHQLLDWAGPLDILSTVSKNELDKPFSLTIVAEDTNPIFLAPIPPPHATWEYAPGHGLSADDKVNHTTTADLSFADALASLRQTGKVSVRAPSGALEQRTIDVLFIPGGVGSRMHRVDKGSGATTLAAQSAVDFVKAVCTEGFVQTAVLTVCTGSDLLAHTGLLDGRRATTNNNAFDKVAARHRGPQWLKHRRWVRSLPGEVEGAVFDREIWTSAGISAGLDLSLWFMAEVYGKDFAKGVGRKLEYEFRSGIGEGEVDPYYTEEGKDGN